MRRSAPTVLPYAEGTWFAVPLRTGGFGVGIVARVNADESGGIVVAYCFGPRLSSLPRPEDLGSLEPKDAVLVCRCGDLGLREGTWPILGAGQRMPAKTWPMPTFVRVNPLSGRSYKVRYSDDDLQCVTAEEPVSLDETHSMPRDGLFGAGAVEIALTNAIEKGRQAKP